MSAGNAPSDACALSTAIEPDINTAQDSAQNINRFLAVIREQEELEATDEGKAIVALLTEREVVEKELADWNGMPKQEVPSEKLLWNETVKQLEAQLHDLNSRIDDGSGNASQTVNASSSLKETAKERRHRLLMWLEEEAAFGKRGALARVTARDKKQRPTADSSNIGKDIKRAKLERDEARRAGPFDQLKS